MPGGGESHPPPEFYDPTNEITDASTVACFFLRGEQEVRKILDTKNSPFSLGIKQKYG